jgi:hypothetical protein
MARTTSTRGRFVIMLMMGEGMPRPRFSAVAGPRNLLGEIGEVSTSQTETMSVRRR